MTRQTRVLLVVLVGVTPLLLAPGSDPCEECAGLLKVGNLVVKPLGLEGSRLQLQVTNLCQAPVGGVWVDLFVDRDEAPGAGAHGDQHVWLPAMKPFERRTVTFKVDDPPVTLRYVDVRVDSPSIISTSTTLTTFELRGGVPVKRTDVEQKAED